MFTETSVSTRLQPRLRDEKKVTDTTKQKTTTDDTMDTSKTNSPEDIYEFKSVKESDSSPDRKSSDAMEMENDTVDPLSTSTSQAEESSKRNFTDTSDQIEDTNNDEESRRKKRKEESSNKDPKATPAARSSGQNKGQGSKQASGTQRMNLSSAKVAAGDRKSPCSSPKPTSDVEEEGKTDLKVPPLKIVIPQTTTSEQETGQSRNGKNSSQRSHQALPYVVASSNSNDSNDKDGGCRSASPTDNVNKGDEKKDGASGSGGEDQVFFVFVYT